MNDSISDTLELKLNMLPDKFGIYIMKDSSGKVIYVGKATSLRNRVRSYFQKGQSHSPKVQMLVSHIADIDWIITENEDEALLLECNLIKKYKPKYNIRLRDDKHYPYLCVTISESFPRVLVVRRIKDDKNKYFGPYADASSMRESLKLIRKIFKIRSCNKKLDNNKVEKPCLNLHLNHCEAPCAGLVNENEYSEMVRNMISFLNGNYDELVSLLTKKMNIVSDNMEYEKAIKYRDQINAIKSMMEKQKAISTDTKDSDIIAAIQFNDSAIILLMAIRSGKLSNSEHFIMDGIIEDSQENVIGEFIKQYYQNSLFIPKEILVSHEPSEKDSIQELLSSKSIKTVRIINPKRGNKLKLIKLALENANEAADREFKLNMSSDFTASEDLKDLCEVLGLDTIPTRIEAFDNSNIQGYDAVSSMVVFVDGIPQKSEYRRFKIKYSNKPDDYENMREVINRRLIQLQSGNSRFNEIPNLILIDGGLGQLNAAYNSMKDTGYDIPMISLAKRLEEIYIIGSTKPILLEKSSKALRLLQRIRDEAHRFAIKYHKNIRDKSVKRSVLDSISGVGESRRKLLIKKFGSATGVSKASLEELISLPGLTESVARSIFEHFND